jgi:hypothetical protein
LKRENSGEIIDEDVDKGWIMIKKMDNSIKLCGPAFKNRVFHYSNQQIAKLMRQGMLSLTDYLVTQSLE